MNGSHDAHLPLIWQQLGGDPALIERVTICGPATSLPSVFDVAGFAAATVAAANLAVAELAALRSGSADIAAVTVQRREAAAAFSCDRLTAPRGWELPPIWDPIAGDYRTADGWIRLHTNYSYHRDAVVSVLGVDSDRHAVTAAVLGWDGDRLEQAVIDAGGCAAVMRTVEQWRAHPAGLASAGEVPVSLTGGLSVRALALPASLPGGRPLDGIKVLDLTRVIAGPVATRFLAAHGADVVRIDPPGFEEVGALLAETTLGKRCVGLDLTDAADREVFERLVGEAHVVVSGLRRGAMAGLGYGPDALRAINPGIISVTHNAYGWSGPWADRRGFDSLVQMSAGIAAAGAAAAETDRPTPLPVQALDHGTGFLLAAGACRALTQLLATATAGDVRGSLVGAANALLSHPTPDGPSTPDPEWTDADTVETTSHWGPLRQVPTPGRIQGHPARFADDRTAGPLGQGAAAFR